MLKENSGEDSTRMTTRAMTTRNPKQLLSQLEEDELKIEPHERQNKIERIIKELKEAFSQFLITNKSERDKVYQLLSKLVHPDKQVTQEQKDKATQAQKRKLKFPTTKDKLNIL